MGLGNNRDYRTRDRLARKSLARHFARMSELIAAGVPRLEASTRAFEEMQRKPKLEGATTSPST
jgi:hypothetical protein